MQQKSKNESCGGGTDKTNDADNEDDDDDVINEIESLSSGKLLRSGSDIGAYNSVYLTRIRDDISRDPQQPKIFGLPVNF